MWGLYRIWRKFVGLIMGRRFSTLISQLWQWGYDCPVCRDLTPGNQVRGELERVLDSLDIIRANELVREKLQEIKNMLEKNKEM